MSHVTCCQWVQVMKTPHYIYQEDVTSVYDFKKRKVSEKWWEMRKYSASTTSLLWNFPVKETDKYKVQIKETMGQKDYHFLRRKRLEDIWIS